MQLLDLNYCDFNLIKSGSNWNLWINLR